MARIPSGAGSKLVKAIADAVYLADTKVVKKFEVPAAKPTSAPRKPRGPRKPKKAPHRTTTTVSGNGRTLPPMTHTSGNMTPEQKAMGFPRGQLDSHTEAKVMRDLPRDLGPGDKVHVQGQYPPCPSCKGRMNAAIRDNPGAEIVYSWPPDNVWRPNGGSRRKGN